MSSQSTWIIVVLTCRQSRQEDQNSKNLHCEPKLLKKKQPKKQKNPDVFNQTCQDRIRADVWTLPKLGFYSPTSHTSWDSHKAPPSGHMEKIPDPTVTGEGNVERNSRSMFVTAVDERENIDFVNNCDLTGSTEYPTANIWKKLWVGKMLQCQRELLKKTKLYFASQATYKLHGDWA